MPSVFDWHQDILSALVQGPPPRGSSLHEAGYRVIVGAVFVLQRVGNSWNPPDDRFNETFLALELYHQWIDHDPHLTLIKNLGDIQSLPDNQVGILLGVEGGYGLTHPLLLRSLYRMGVRLLGLTWNVDNLLAASCKTSYDYGITGLGYQIIDEALSLGILIDLAHASSKTRKDFYTTYRSIPPLFSHGSILPSPQDPRNLPQHEMDFFQNGLVGLAVGSIFFEQNPLPLDRLALLWKETFEHYPSSVGVGTDFFGLSPDMLPPQLQSWDELPALVQALKRQGFEEDHLKKLFCDNSVHYVQRFLHAVSAR